ncbi:MAG: PaaI family thioesterase [Terriglobia bacterium]
MVKQIFEAWARGNQPPVAELIGFSLQEFSPESAVIAFEAGPQHANPMGTLHGGILCDISDAAMGAAWASGLAEGETFTTMELKINFFRPVWSGKLTAAARVIRRGRTTGYVECDVHDEAGKLVSRAGSTCMTLRGEQALGR